MALLAATIGCGGGGTSGGGGGGGNNTPNYSIRLQSTPITLVPGGSQSLIVLISATNGFSGDVSVSFSGLPTGVTASPATFTISSSGVQQVLLSAAGTAAAGTSTVTVNGSSGTLSQVAQFQLTVTGPPSISLSLNPTSLSLIPGISQPVQISVSATTGYNQLISGTLTGIPSGVSANSTTFSVFPGGTATIYFTATSSAVAGTVQIAASSGTLTASAQLPVSIDLTPDFELTTGTNNVLIMSQGASTSMVLSAVGLNGFSQPVSVSFSGAPTGVTVTPASFTLQPGGPSQTIKVSASFSAAVNQNAVFTATGLASGLSHQLLTSLSIVRASVSVGVQPSSLIVPAGSTNLFELSVSNQSLGTPSGNISIAISRAPAGVTISPTSYTAPPQGVGFDVFVQAAANASPGTITVTAAYGPVQATASVAIAIGSAEHPVPVPLSTADQLLRADSITPYNSFPPPNYTIYHAATQRFFASEPFMDRVYVVDAVKRTLAATLTIPGAFGLDQAPDGSVLYVGTMLGDLYVVDPVNLTILKRYASSTISPYGFSANAVYALADGKLILEKYFLVPGYSWVDGDGPIALWDPQTNDIKVFYAANSGNAGTTPQAASCLSGFENVVLTNNRTRVLLAPVITSEGSSALCSLDPEAGTWNWSGLISGGSGSALTTFGVSQDGNTLVAFDGYNIYNLDPATFAVKSTIPVPEGPPGITPDAVLLVSADNSSVFITDQNGADIFDEYSLTTGKMTGWISQVSVPSPDSYTPFQPFYQAITPGGLAAGVTPGAGIGLLDTTAVHAPPVGSRFTDTSLLLPYGPVNGGTLTGWLPNAVGVAPPPLGSIYFGTNIATDTNNNGFAGFLEAVTPAGAAGPVDVRTFATDGASQLIPDGFSYGPWVVESLPTYSTADGGGQGDLFGYGLGPNLYTGGALFIAPPSDLQVMVGGASAAVTDFSPNPYGSTYFAAPIFPTKAAHYTIPGGIAGAASTITVSNDSGTTTAAQTITYLPAIEQYPVSGELADGIYDPVRDVYYFTDASQIRVFSLTQNAWLSPIPVPAPQGAAGPQRLVGMAISPDGTKLAVADAGAYAVYVINLNQPSSIQSYSSSAWGFSETEAPTAVAITNSGNVYVATSDFNGDGGTGGLLLLNPSSGTRNVGPGGLGSLPTEGGSIGTFLASSADGARIYFNDGGELGFIDSSSGQVTVASIGQTDLGQGSYEIEMGANQTRLFADGFMTDSNLNAIGLQTLNVAESIDAAYVYGAAFSADGSLFFQPGLQSIDLFDGVTGAFRGRIALPVRLSPNFRALVPNNKDSRLIAITGDTGNGIAVIDLNSLPEPTPVTWLQPEAAPAMAWQSGSNPMRVKPFAQPSRFHRAPGRLISNLLSSRAASRY